MLWAESCRAPCSRSDRPRRRRNARHRRDRRRLRAEAFAPVLGLGVVYLLAVLPAAIVGGLAVALPVSVASMLAFNFFFLPPVHTLRLHETENWVALAVYLVVAVAAADLAARARRRAEDAEQRGREAAFAANVSAMLVEPGFLQDKVGEIGSLVAGVLGAGRGGVELESLRRPQADEVAHALVAGERRVGQLVVHAGGD